MKNIRSLNFLELFNEIIRYVIILLSLFTIVSYGLFTYGLINTDYSYLSTELFLSIIYVLLVLLLSNTKKGAVSPFSTYVLLILSILNTYGIYVYLFMNSGLFYIIGEGLNNFVMANIIYNLMLVSFISSLVLNISLFFRFVIIGQYKYYELNGIMVLNAKNYMEAYNSVFVSSDNLFLNLFLYLIGYVGFSQFMSEINSSLYGSGLNTTNLIIGVFCFIFSIIALFMYRKISTHFTKYLSFAVFFIVFILFFSIMLSLSNIISSGKYFFIAYLIASCLGFCVSLHYLTYYFIKKKARIN